MISSISQDDLSFIDPASFHVFEFEGDRLLFDRATASTIELNEPAYRILHLVENEGLERALDLADSVSSELRSEDVLEWLRSLKDNGFFRLRDLDLEKQDKAIEGLWRHRPKRIQLMLAEACNLACGYCYQWRNHAVQKQKLMSWRVARTAVDYLVWRSGNRRDLQVTFFGGEPLLNLGVLKRVVAYCRDIESLG